MILKTVTVGDYERRRRKYLPYIRKAIPYGDQNIDQMEREILRRESIVLTISSPRLIGVTVVKKQGPVLHITIVSGEFAKGWEIQFIQQMKLLAGVMGCSTLRGKGRKGWERVLKKYGFHMKQNYLVSGV